MDLQTSSWWWWTCRASVDGVEGEGIPRAKNHPEGGMRALKDVRGPAVPGSQIGPRRLGRHSVDGMRPIIDPYAPNPSCWDQLAVEVSIGNRSQICGGQPTTVGKIHLRAMRYSNLSKMKCQRRNFLVFTRKLQSKKLPTQFTMLISTALSITSLETPNIEISTLSWMF